MKLCYQKFFFLTVFIFCVLGIFFSCTKIPELTLEEIEELVGKKLPEGDYETLAGFIMDELQCIPKDGDMNEVVFENVKFTVLEVEDRRIEKIKVEISDLEKEIPLHQWPSSSLR